MASQQDAVGAISALIRRARSAQQAFEFASQEQVDDLTARVAWAVVKPDFAQRLAETLVAESGMGNVPHKVLKIMNKVKGTFRDMKGRKSVGIVDRKSVV